MTLTIILICLIAERFLLEHRHLRSNRWFTRYCQWHQQQNLPEWMQQGIIGLLLLLLPPLLAIAALQHLFADSLLGLPSLLLSIGVLLYALGPQDLDSQINQYVETAEADDGEARRIAREIIEDEPPTSEPARSQAVAEAALQQANRRTVAVLFWFILLGPLGAILYRLATWMPQSDQAAQDIDFKLNTRQLVIILDWLPARITAFCYAIAGSFEDALYGWRSYQESRQSEFSDSNAGTLICTGSGAMRLTTLLDEAYAGAHLYTYLPKAAMALIWRSLIVFLVILAFLTFTGLI
ncbi:MAG: regulatory signaling modulator protein AmpE [Candidatus Thiodiazotropha lotti]|uniref:Regulatory signaling modulator protein AmpE n=1 Tax=Candidatus Thiodiazotropha endoloripes TaxID=1818881 RepID=A0A1E2ULX5_9GAMM|nr:regulatory signaling modulator protein AmpE [Candidatus Thiodiazotropha endoloripes]MCG7898905.1 regulatory signaling modulator protein AmpE [Candidatus Thiodiazotropha weberae]MCG7991994.1 regulatory signaling modulator protein AmpE [Candidatus Thiodiazotropha lotti]MCG7902032.1 regulatory signaling modulator protein AmpE [Candidatus Thiodiazotropha weberae]MCG7914953.1 regulatory signaling modulator protein AmpE [Candidatus Thiodiazotropha weberae]MCG7998498.1 regulatory signaling modulat